MKPTIQLQLTPKLALNKKLQQAIQLLQLSTVELNQEVEEAVRKNPLLELNDSKSEIRYGSASDWFQERIAVSDLYDANDENNSSPYWEESLLGLRDHLNLQINASRLADRKKKIIGLLIDSLDDDGYLKQGLDELVVLLPPVLKIDESDLEVALKYLQHMDPPGVGARDLKECLSIQLKVLPKDTPFQKEALSLVNNCLQSLASRNFKRIKRAIGFDENCIYSAWLLIVNLNPKPGAVFGSVAARYITPDVLVAKVKGAWVVNLNSDALPKLTVNQGYADIIKSSRGSPDSGISGQLKEAKWFVSNIEQYFNTILKVSRVIIKQQRQFFEHGAVAMRPLTLKDVALRLKVNESTVSRVTTQKFMHTPHGIFELKYFFGSHVSTDTGGVRSATAIRALIKELIQAENIKKPLSDDRISGLLEKQGIVIARRTVAKYRESIQIPPANRRKLF